MRDSQNAYSLDHFSSVNRVSVPNLADGLTMNTDSRTRFASWFNETNGPP